MTNVEVEDFTEQAEKLIDDIVEVLCKNEGAHGGAVLAALSSITAQAIRIYSVDGTDAARANTLDVFIATVKVNLDLKLH